MRGAGPAWCRTYGGTTRRSHAVTNAKPVGRASSIVLEEQKAVRGFCVFPALKTPLGYCPDCGRDLERHEPSRSRVTKGDNPEPLGGWSAEVQRCGSRGIASRLDLGAFAVDTRRDAESREGSRDVGAQPEGSEKTVRESLCRCEIGYSPAFVERQRERGRISGFKRMVRATPVRSATQ